MLGKIVSGVVVPTTMNSMSVGVEPGLGDGGARRFGGEVGGGHARIDDVALANAGALQDPLVGRLDEALEVAVGQHPRRHVGRERRDAGTTHGHGRPSPVSLRVLSSGHHRRASFPGAVSPKYS